MSEVVSEPFWQNKWFWLGMLFVGLAIGLGLHFGLKKSDNSSTIVSSSHTSSDSDPSPTPFNSPTPSFTPFTPFIASGQSPSPTPRRSSASISGMQPFYPDTSTITRTPADMGGVDPLCSTKKCVFCVPTSSFKQVTNNDKDEYVDNYTTMPFYMIPKNNQTGEVMGTCPPDTIMVNNKPGQCIDCKSQYTDMICQHNKVNYAETVDSCLKGFRGTHTGKVYRGTVSR